MTPGSETGTGTGVRGWNWPWGPGLELALGSGAGTDTGVQDWNRAEPETKHRNQVFHPYSTTEEPPLPGTEGHDGK